jgi:hypothetical protein
MTGSIKLRDYRSRNNLDHAGFMERRGPAGVVAENVAMGCETDACLSVHLVDPNR